jgi:hypothetical protein
MPGNLSGETEGNHENRNQDIRRFEPGISGIQVRCVATCDRLLGYAGYLQGIVGVVKSACVEKGRQEMFTKIWWPCPVQ